MNQSILFVRMASLLLLLVHRSDANMSIILSKQDVKVGEEILLLCKAGGEGDITWQKDGEDAEEENVIPVDETSSKLIIKKATTQDAGKYTCLCEFDNGHHDKTQVALYVYEGPSFGDTSTYHEFLEGTDGVVPCVVTGQPEVAVKWIRNNREVSSDSGLHLRQMPDNTLLIEKVKREDHGIYNCRAQIRGRPISQTLPVSVVINAPPTAHLREEVKRVLAGRKNNVTLSCLVDGHPKPNINWTMPVAFDPSHHGFNSDRSKLIIASVTMADYGEYVCTATNKIAESSATILLHVFEAPEVFVTVEKKHVSVGENVAVSCNVSGHPQPELHWLNKHNGHPLRSTSGRVRVIEGVLMIDDLMPSDGGLYSCMAVSISGNASRDVEIITQPGSPHYLTVSSDLNSILFSFKTPPSSGGAPITIYVLQWRRNPSEDWQETTVPASDPLVIADLEPYTDYAVRLAALNEEGLGQFSDINRIRTRGIRGEPDSPVLISNEMKVEGNSFTIPFKQTDSGRTPLLHFNVRYRQDKEGAEWKERRLSVEADSVSLKDLAFGSNYQLEVAAVNANDSSLFSSLNFTIAEQPVSSSMTKGSVVGIVMVIFLVVFLVIDATCCYTNRCGLLMSIAVQLFGRKVPGLKNIEEGDGTNKGELNLKGVSTLTDSMQGVQNLSKDSDRITEVTCDKAPLTKHEKTQPDRELPAADA